MLIINRYSPLLSVLSRIPFISPHLIPISPHPLALSPQLILNAPISNEAGGAASALWFLRTCQTLGIYYSPFLN